MENRLNLLNLSQYCYTKDVKVAVGTPYQRTFPSRFCKPSFIRERIMFVVFVMTFFSLLLITKLKRRFIVLGQQFSYLHLLKYCCYHDDAKFIVHTYSSASMIFIRTTQMLDLQTTFAIVLWYSRTENNATYINQPTYCYHEGMKHTICFNTYF